MKTCSLNASMHSSMLTAFSMRYKAGQAVTRDWLIGRILKARSWPYSPHRIATELFATCRNHKMAKKRSRVMTDRRPGISRSQCVLQCDLYDRRRLSAIMMRMAMKAFISATSTSVNTFCCCLIRISVLCPIILFYNYRLVSMHAENNLQV